MSSYRAPAVGEESDVELHPVCEDRYHLSSPRDFLVPGCGKVLYGQLQRLSR
jgi:hypothetical protein